MGMGWTTGRPTAIALAAALALSGCQTIPEPGSAGLTGTNRSALAEQTADYRRTIVEGAQVGAIVGGLGAALATAASGGDAGQIARNGALGATVGSLLGAAAGTGVANTKRDAVRQEDQLNAVIGQARANNAKLSRMVATVDALVRERRSQAAALSRESDMDRRALASAIGADRRTLSSAIAASDREIGNLEALRDRSRNAALGREIDTAKTRNRRLDDARATLTDIQEKL